MENVLGSSFQIVSFVKNTDWAVLAFILAITLTTGIEMINIAIDILLLK